jgi:hypothetical protein
LPGNKLRRAQLGDPELQFDLVLKASRLRRLARRASPFQGLKRWIFQRDSHFLLQWFLASDQERSREGAASAVRAADQKSARHEILFGVRRCACAGLPGVRLYGESSTMSDLLPDQFLYGRKGPWPQPSPTHPFKEAFEVLNIPPIEALLWNATIGKRLLETQVGYTGAAAYLAALDDIRPIPDDREFNRIMWETAYTRYMKPVTEPYRKYVDPKAVKSWIYDFSAMKLVEPMDGMYCEPVVCIFGELADRSRSCTAIVFRGDTHDKDVQFMPSGDPAAWQLAKIFALQGAAYHMLFVVHPALHFPMDSVNAITKTAVPHTHPLFQLLYPHTSYTLALDNAVLEGPESVVNDNPMGTWFDPLMGKAYNLKLLFAAGYTGLPDPWYEGAYPAYDYMKPRMGFDSDYGIWLNQYFNVISAFCQAVASMIDPGDEYVQSWAQYNSLCVKGFPDKDAIRAPGVLGKVLAIYLWDVTVAHGGDHYSFGRNIEAAYKFLRIRHKPPTVPGAKELINVGQVCNGDDLYRSQMAHRMFFAPSTIFPNLHETIHPCPDPLFAVAQAAFIAEMELVSGRFFYSKDTPFMPLTEAQAKQVIADIWPKVDPYTYTLPTSIQY